MKLHTPMIALLVTTLALLTVPLIASAASPDGPPGDAPEMAGPPPGHHGMGGPGMGGPQHHTLAQRAKFRAKMKRRFGKLLRNKLQLPEATAKRVEQLVHKSMKRRRPLRKQMRGYHQTLRRLLKEDSQDQRAFSDALAGIHRTRKALRAIHEGQIKGFQGLLTPKQQAQLMAAHHRMRRHMRRGGRRGGKRGWRKGSRRGMQTRMPPGMQDRGAERPQE